MFNKDFYPTPHKLISRMLEGIDWSKVNCALEPSAGKGDICKAIERSGCYGRKIDVDAIEIDPNLQSILRSSGHRLVFDDFLRFRTGKKYDLIVANFPFSDGDKHLAHALEMIESGGNLVCLVNAETIMNPYSSLRTHLVRKLESYGASIEYISDAFIDSERKTGVEVALIKVCVEDRKNGLIFRGMKEAGEIPETEERSGQVIDADPIIGLVRRFEFESRIGSKMIDEYFSVKPFLSRELKKEDYCSDLIRLEINGCSYHETKSQHINAYMTGLRSKYWQALIRNPKFRNQFTSNIIKDLEEKLDELKDYDFCEFNINNLSVELNGSLGKGIEETIMSLFDELSRKHSYGDQFDNGNIHYFNGWKTNKAHRINGKVIIPFYGFERFFGNGFDSYRVNDKMNDIVKALNFLQNELSDIPAIVGSATSEAHSIENYKKVDYHYFYATFYKKGTCHIEFKDRRLLDKFNIFGCQRKGWLPPSYGRRGYSEMEEEEKAVIDEFQGKDSYNAVMADRDGYIIEEMSGKFLS